GGKVELEHRAVGTGFVMGMEGLLEAFETRMDEDEWPKQRVGLICVEATFQAKTECELLLLLLDDLFDTLESFPQLLHDMRFALRLPMGVHEQQQNRLARSRGIAASAVRDALASEQERTFETPLECMSQQQQQQ
ncbi:unnamed protein product, partial [Closterium sp. Yama58-4]